MQAQETLSARLRADLSAFIGTEQWHRHALNRHMLVTDGVKYFAETAGCYWFLDIVATEVFRLQATHPFLLITSMSAKGKPTSVPATATTSFSSSGTSISPTHPMDCGAST